MSYRSSASALPSSKKTHSERHKQILKQLLREEPNKTCADCKVSKNPRWASWSLGCFVCIRCSGIHRSMGTHISKVKSVDLDAWTDDQIENVIKWGNEKCNLYWEAKLPEGYIPDSSKIENFIRTKYELKKWTASTHIPDPLTMKPQSQPLPQPPTNGKQPINPIVSPAPPTITQSPQSTGGSTGSGRPDLKKSILSLYASPSSSSSFVGQFQQPPPQPSPHLRTQPYNASVNSLNNSLSGLSFNSTVKVQPQANISQTSLRDTKPPVPVAANSTWNNEWSDSSQGSYNNNQWKATTTTSNGLDDDLFKNVWN
ncbi:uncharacterized protein SPAPADRAFT_136340 [Spathaspora passalidarum NRRL Y-27907]|uniref:Arf-GAP domain-containing protein n=1 Tax=Spathaspora passalidarum (strain NRRL Y-27907 / 11-Y1) TaxID=619300 RepID=G3AMF0_SPAPN|nr:uncharacterized protein SPAPADRAFT_136340 [Spathaspora passalidarum NRRL Y-27907]EGW32803.1 hypothetical protein SPAPADRAFT_136340 [Spathaspora passalidarum NRRL Y-27907]